LTHTREPVPIFAKLILKCRKLCGPNYIKPIWIILFALISHIEHRETVNIKPRFRFLGFIGDSRL
jgi:hypothetical protein